MQQPSPDILIARSGITSRTTNVRSNLKLYRTLKQVGPREATIFSEDGSKLRYPRLQHPYMGRLWTLGRYNAYPSETTGARDGN